VKSDNKSLDNNNKKLSNQQPNIDDKKNIKNKSIGNPLIAGNVLNLINLMHFLKNIKIHKKIKKYINTKKNNCLNFVNIQIYSIDVFVQNSILQLTSPFLIGVKYFNQRNFSLV